MCILYIYVLLYMCCWVYIVGLRKSACRNFCSFQTDAHTRTYCRVQWYIRNGIEKLQCAHFLPFNHHFISRCFSFVSFTLISDFELHSNHFLISRIIFTHTHFTPNFILFYGHNSATTIAIAIASDTISLFAINGPVQLFLAHKLNQLVKGNFQHSLINLIDNFYLC